VGSEDVPLLSFLLFTTMTLTSVTACKYQTDCLVD